MPAYEVLVWIARAVYAGRPCAVALPLTQARISSPAGHGGSRQNSEENVLATIQADVD